MKYRLYRKWAKHPDGFKEYILQDRVNMIYVGNCKTKKEAERAYKKGLKALTHYHEEMAKYKGV